MNERQPGRWEFENGQQLWTRLMKIQLFTSQQALLPTQNPTGNEELLYNLGLACGTGLRDHVIYEEESWKETRTPVYS